MIAQVAAAQEMRRRSATGQPSRVRSLFLSVTSRGIHPVGSLAHGMRWVLPLGHRLGLVRRLVPFLLQPSLSTVLKGLHRPRMVQVRWCARPALTLIGGLAEGLGSAVLTVAYCSAISNFSSRASATST